VSGKAVGPYDGTLSRRDFIASCGAAAAIGPLLGAAYRPAPVPPYPLGIQLYTLRDLLRSDFDATLTALARIGYREVEFAGLHGRTSKNVRTLLDKLGLAAPSGHADLSDISPEKLPQTITDAKTLGHRYVVVPWLPEDMRTALGYASVAGILNQVGERLRNAGLSLGYHNHWFEFAPLDGDRCGYDILLENTNAELVTMELDLYWIRKGGRDALAYFQRHIGRFRLVHVKDMAADGGMVDVGQGTIDWPTVLAAAKRAGVEHYFVEHDEAKDPLLFARESFKYLQGLRW
jgi:sugar phosphate isomerase/epimerase